MRTIIDQGDITSYCYSKYMQVLTDTENCACYMCDSSILPKRDNALSFVYLYIFYLFIYLQIYTKLFRGLIFPEMILKIG